MKYTHLVSLSALAFSSAQALAQHRGDIVLTLSSSPEVRIVTNRFDLAGILTPDIRTFPAAFGDFGQNSTDNPGFDCTPGTFPYPSSNGFRIRRALRIWNGTNFDTIPSERIAIAFNVLGPIYTPLTDVVLPGFTLAVGSNGEWHKHLEYTLSDPAEPGIYLLELELFSTVESIGQSLPFWMVFNQNSDQADADAAAQWVRDHLEHPPVCAADWNQSGMVDSQDFFDFLASFFAGSADFNADGATNSQDFFDFLGAFFAGC